MKNLILLLMLSGCAMDSYRPEVAQPQDAKYEADLKNCIQYSKDVRSRADYPKTAVVGVFGLLGTIYLEETKDPKDPYFKDGYELTNECLAEKGYALK